MAIKIIAVRFCAITVFKNSQVGAALDFLEILIIGRLFNFNIVGIAFFCSL